VAFYISVSTTSPDFVILVRMQLCQLKTRAHNGGNVARNCRFCSSLRCDGNTTLNLM